MLQQLFLGSIAKESGFGISTVGTVAFEGKYYRTPNNIELRQTTKGIISISTNSNTSYSDSSTMTPDDSKKVEISLDTISSIGMTSNSSFMLVRIK